MNSPALFYPPTAGTEDPTAALLFSLLTYRSQSDNSGALRWKFENLRLLIDQGQGGGYEDVGLTATRNSNGSIILHADGREYAMCK